MFRTWLVMLMAFFLANRGVDSNVLKAFLINKKIDYSHFEKGFRKKAPKCTRQDRKVVWVFTGILYIGIEEMYKLVFLHVENLFSSKEVALLLLSHVFTLRKSSKVHVSEKKENVQFALSLDLMC